MVTPLSSGKAEESVKVVVRIRPISQKELQDGHVVIAQANEETGEIIVQNCRDTAAADAPKTFTFDSVFGDTCTQKHVYETCAAPVVESVLDGYNGTIFAYGQTGTGKTHTMEGDMDSPSERGIIPNSFQHIFDHVSVSKNQQFLVRASYLEIYNEEIRDLLSKDPKNKLELKETPDKGVYVKDLTTFVVKSAKEIEKVMQAGKKNRSVGATLMNQTSSRSHSIFTIIVECASTTTITAAFSNGNNDRSSGGKRSSQGQQQQQQQQQHIRVGKLNLVDLAGSERQSKTGATGDRFKEATKINLSLSALGNVISALVDGKSQHIPYRDSKLTRLLQDSLGGNTKTVMCANCGPAEYNYEETISTLRYANRAKNIKNKPHINEDPKDTMLREFQDEIHKLKAQLAARENGIPLLADGALPLTAERKDDNVVVEKIVEKIIHIDASKEQRAAWEAKAEKEKEELKSQAKKDVEDKEAMFKQRLLREVEERKVLQEKLRAMEAKLIQGGELADKAHKQEALLLQTKVDLNAQQQQQRRLAQELAIKEETNLVLEEQYSSLQEEVDSKTKKLKKLWIKLQTANREIADLQEEFQREREDMIDTIRQLARQLKLKDVVLTNFVPPEEAKRIEQQATWSDELDNWTIGRLELAGNNLLTTLKRPVSIDGLRRPETEYARARKLFDKDPRFRYDNLLELDLDLPGEGTTQHYVGPETVSNIAQILDMPLDETTEKVLFSDNNGVVSSSPYLKYAYHHQEEPSAAPTAGKTATRKPKITSSSPIKTDRRPTICTKEEEEEDDELYPSARGLLSSSSRR